MSQPLRPEDFVEAGPRIRTANIIWEEDIASEQQADSVGWIALLSAEETARVQAEAALVEDVEPRTPLKHRSATPGRYHAELLADDDDDLESDRRARRRLELREQRRAAAAQGDIVKVRRAIWALTGFAGILAVLAIVLVAVSVQMWRARTEVQVIGDRLTKLQDFETRIVGRLDSFNTGIQGLITKTNDTFYETRSQVEETATVSRTAAGEIATSLEELQGMVSAMRAQASEPVEEKPVRRRAPGARQAATASASAADAGVFERIVNSDGSTTYRIR